MQKELAVAIEAARAAGAIHRAELGSAELNIGTKSSSIDLVTRVDTASEAAIREILRRSFPEDGILGEEEGQEGSGAARQWVVDPLDGTLNYAHGFPYFAVSIALREGGRGLVGVVYDAWKDELFTAARGEGASLNGHPIHVSDRAPLAQAMLATGFAYEGRWMRENLALFGAMLGKTRALRRPGAAALDLAYVAAGRLDGFWELYLKPWDTAAGILLVREAGGIVTDGRGGPYAPGDRAVVAAGPALHAELVSALDEAGIGAVP